MGRDYYYKPGSFYRICDRTGFRVRADRTKKEWNNLIVRDQSWERRQPQDFVKGVRDDQTVPEARPRPAFTFDGPYDSTLSAEALPNARYVFANSPFPFQVGNRLGIMIDFDKGTVFFCTVVPAGTVVGFGDYNRDYSKDYFGPGGTRPAGFSDGFSSGLAVDPPGSIWIAPLLPWYAKAGNLITNFSAPELIASGYGASNGG